MEGHKNTTYGSSMVGSIYYVYYGEMIAKLILGAISTNDRLSGEQKTDYMQRLCDFFENLYAAGADTDSKEFVHARLAVSGANTVFQDEGVTK